MSVPKTTVKLLSWLLHITVTEVSVEEACTLVGGLHQWSVRKTSSSSASLGFLGNRLLRAI